MTVPVVVVIGAVVVVVGGAHTKEPLVDIRVAGGQHDIRGKKHVDGGH